MPVNREDGIITPPPVQKTEAPALMPTPVPSGVQRIQPGIGMPQRVPQSAENTFFDEDNGAYAQPERPHHIKRKVVAGFMGILLVGGVAYDAGWNNHQLLEEVTNTLLGMLPAGAPVAEAPRPAPVPSVSETTTQEPTLSSPTTTHHHPKPTPTKAPAVAPSVTVTPEQCITKWPLAAKIGQSIMLPVSATSDFKTLNTIAAQDSIGSWLIESYPTNPNGSLNTAVVAGLKSVEPYMKTVVATDQEGGVVERIPDTSLLSQDKLSATQIAPAALEATLTADYEAKLKANNIDINLAPVADISTVAGQQNGRMFRSAADSAKYLPVYNKAAAAAKIMLTYKHFPDLLPFGNTDTAVVHTSPYDLLLQNGSLDAYKLLRGTDNLAMMSSAFTAHLPNVKIDNGKINAFNPAAYAALRGLSGENTVVMTDDLGVTHVPVDQAVLASLQAGANIATIAHPDQGLTLSQEVTKTLATVTAAVENDTLPQTQLNASTLKVLGMKGVSACVALENLDPKAYAALHGAPTPHPIGSPTSQPSATSTVAAIAPKVAIQAPKAAATPTK